MSKPYTDLCPLAELEESGVMEVSTGNRRFAVVCSDRQVQVFAGACPHRGGPIGRGRVACEVVSTGPGARFVDAEHHVLMCPWHGWEFSLRDGTALADPQIKLRAFPTQIRDGRVLARL